MSHVIIWKYREEDGTLMNYFDDGGANPRTINYIDKIKINYISQDGFPQFEKKSESDESPLEYVSGDFDLKFSLLQSETSYNGATIEEFLFPETYPNKFVVVVYFNDSCHFSGTFTTSDLEKNLTFNENDYYVNIHVIGILKEFGEAYSMEHRGTRVVPYGNNSYRLEPYLNFHFDSRAHWSFEFPSRTYAQEIGDTTVVMNSQLMNAVYAPEFADLAKVSRWQTFKDLAMGLGFQFDLIMENPANIYDVNYPDFTLKIIYTTNIENETPVDLTILSHDETYLVRTQKYVFAGTRHYIRTGGTATVINGVLFNAYNSYNTDSSNFVDDENFLIFNEGTNLVNTNHILRWQINALDGGAWDRDSEVLELPLTLYSSPQFGSFFRQGSMAFSRMFCGSVRPYDHLPIQRYLIRAYARYLTGNKRRKVLTVEFNGTEGIDLYKRVVLDGVSYWISAIESIDLQAHTAEITVIEL